jgi:SAM-dependent methyltransferase
MGLEFIGVKLLNNKMKIMNNFFDWAYKNLILNKSIRLSKKLTIPKLIWSDDNHLKINDVNFYLSMDITELRASVSSLDRFLLGKNKKMVEQFVAIGEKKCKKIFDMGILQGGSVVLYDQIFYPKKIVAIDHSPYPVDALTDYVNKNNKAKVLKPHYGVNQADRSAMEKILSAEFADRDIDLIIDDASHLYDETREAFNICFPYLKKGGIYIIEDWAWAHWSGDCWQKDNEYFRERKALSNFLIELFMLSASRPDLISNILIDSHVIKIIKGFGHIPNIPFNIEEHYLLRGKRFEPLL